MEEADSAAVEDLEVAAVSRAALVCVVASVAVIAACLRRAEEARTSDRARLAASGLTRIRDSEACGPAWGMV